METSNLPDAEFKILAMRKLCDLNENVNKEIGNIKMEIENIKNQSEMKNAITEMKNTLKGINTIRLDEGED